MATEAQNQTLLGSPAPEFVLPDVVTGETVTLSGRPHAKALLVMFICRHCPYVAHVRDELVHLARDYQPQDVDFIAICANDAIKYPDDSPEKLKDMAIEYKFPFPLLYDESQQAARDYDARCTPDFFLFDGERCLAYRGRLDASTPGNDRPVTGSEMRQAIDSLLIGENAPTEQRPAIGCSIKWRQ